MPRATRSSARTRGRRASRAEPRTLPGAGRQEPSAGEEAIVWRKWPGSRARLRWRNRPQGLTRPRRRASERRRSRCRESSRCSRGVTVALYPLVVVCVDTMPGTSSASRRPAWRAIPGTPRSKNEGQEEQEDGVGKAHGLIIMRRGDGGNAGSRLLFAKPAFVRRTGGFMQ